MYVEDIAAGADGEDVYVEDTAAGADEKDM